MSYEMMGAMDGADKAAAGHKHDMRTFVKGADGVSFENSCKRCGMGARLSYEVSDIVMRGEALHNDCPGMFPRDK